MYRRGELGAKENAASMSGADVYTNSGSYVLYSVSVPHPCTSSNTGPMLHSNQSQNFKEHLQKDQGIVSRFDMIYRARQKKVIP